MNLYIEIINKTYDAIENNNVEKAVMCCLRLARRRKDHLNTAIFLRELYADKEQFARVFYEDVNEHKKEAIQFLFETSLNIWLSSRTLVCRLDSDEDEEKVLSLGIGDIDSQISYAENTIQDQNLPSGMGEYDTAAFTSEILNTKASFRIRISTLQTIRNRIKARCLNYAISVEKQITAQQKGVSFLETVQESVNNYFRAYAEDVYHKLQKAVLLINSNDEEDNAALLLHIRRALKSVADHFYPATSEKVLCSDQKHRVLGEDQYLNRLEEFIRKRFPSNTSNELIHTEMELIVTFARRINDISSKGVHSTATMGEAKQGLLGLYMFLYNVISKIQIK